MTPEEFDQLLSDYDEWAEERLEIIQNINAAQLGGEIGAGQAAEIADVLLENERNLK